MQENVKRQVEVNVEDKTPEASTLNQEAEPRNETVKPVKDIGEGSPKKVKEVKEEVPPTNQHVEEKI